MSIAFLIEKEQAVVWRGPMLSKAISQFCTDVKWGELDYLIVDLPPGTGDVHLSILQHVPLSGVVMVTTPEDVAVADTRKAIDMFNNPHLKQNIFGIIENMSYFTPNDQDKYYLFGKEGGKKLGEEFDLEVLTEIPIKEDKSFDSLKHEFTTIVGKLVQKLSIIAAS
jgi:ATP-binding protein involved in chromosome partitioning